MKVKSLSHFRLCDPMNCSLPGSSVHGIFQARILKWVVISFSRGSFQPRDDLSVLVKDAATSCHVVLCCAWLLSHVWLCATPWVVACQAPLSMGILQARILEWVAVSFSRGFAQPRDQIWVTSLQADSLPAELPGKPSVQVSSFTQLCPTPSNPVDYSTPGFPVHHQCPELTQTHAHHITNGIQQYHPLSSNSLSAFNLYQPQDLFTGVSSLHQVAEVLEFQLQHQFFQWIFRTEFL